MGTLLQQIYSVLTGFPGNIVYHIIVSFSVLNALVSTISTKKKSKDSIRIRTLYGLGTLLAIRVLVFLYSVIFPPLSEYSAALLPIFDWLTTCISLMVIIWLWVFPKRSKIPDVIVPAVGVLTLISAIFSGGWWIGAYQGQSFNQSFLDDAWNLYSVLLLSIGIVLMAIRTPINYGSGLGMLVILLLGHILHIAFPNSAGYFPSSVRLFQIAAYPLLFTLSRRWESQEEPRPVLQEKTFEIDDTGPYRIEPGEFQHIRALFEEFFPIEIEQLVARIVGEIMKTDICFRIVHTLDRKFTLKGGYDRHLQKGIEEITLHEKEVPLLTSTSHQSKSLRLQASSTSPDLFNLSKAMGLSSSGHLLVGFFSAFDNSGILLLNPHSKKRWDQEGQKYFVEITNSIHKFFKDMENFYIYADDEEIEISPDLNARRESKIQKETLLKLIDFLESQPT